MMHSEYEKEMLPYREDWKERAPTIWQMFNGKNPDEYVSLLGILRNDEKFREMNQHGKSKLCKVSHEVKLPFINVLCIYAKLLSLWPLRKLEEFSKEDASFMQLITDVNLYHEIKEKYGDMLDRTHEFYSLFYVPKIEQHVEKKISIIDCIDVLASIRDLIDFEPEQ